MKEVWENVLYSRGNKKSYSQIQRHIFSDCGYRTWHPLAAGLKRENGDRQMG